jgi:DNA invertase Pin-like site-specific DNA recombinase
MAHSQQITAVSYLRVSGRGQLRGDGFPRQRDAIARFAKANGYRTLEEFRDEGISGTRELDDRPGLAALLDRVEHNHVKTVLVENASRLARDLMVQEVVLEQFRKAGVSVIAADAGTDLTVADGDPTRKLIRQVLGAFAEFDKSITVLKLRAARERIRGRTGHCEGPRPYGSYPGETALLARMQQLRRKPVKGKRPSYAIIAATLNEAEFTNRAGRPWSSRMVFYTLKTAAARKLVRDGSYPG